MKWFRCYTDILDDHKISTMSPDTFKIMMFLFAYCSEKDNGGIINEDADKIMWRLRYLDSKQKDTFHAAIKELVLLNVIKLNKKTQIVILNWNTRQYKSDNSSDRVKKHRLSKKKNKAVTPNVTVSETPPDTDTDKKQNKKEQILKLKDSFICLVKAYKEKNKENENYSDVMIDDFINYWTELNPSGTKMRYQGEKFFALGRRLGTWKKNSKKTFDSKKVIKSEFRLDRTGTSYIARCTSCNKTDFYSKFEPMDRSKCCEGVLEPDQKN